MAAPPGARRPPCTGCAPLFLQLCEDLAVGAGLVDLLALLGTELVTSAVLHGVALIDMLAGD